MPNVNEMIESKYLKKEDVGSGVLWTIASLDKQNVAQQGEPPEYKWTVHFEESRKPLVLNTTNINLLALICGSHNSDDWIGRRVVLFNDPSVSYAGKMIGGIRVRAPQGKAAKVHSVAEANAKFDAAAQDDDIPF